MNHADEVWVDTTWLRSTTATYTWPNAGRCDGRKQQEQIRAVIRSDWNWTAMSSLFLSDIHQFTETQTETSYSVHRSVTSVEQELNCWPLTSRHFWILDSGSGMWPFPLSVWVCLSVSESLTLSKSLNHFEFLNLSESLYLNISVSKSLSEPLCVSESQSLSLF